MVKAKTTRAIGQTRMGRADGEGQERKDRLLGVRRQVHVMIGLPALGA